MRTDIYYDSMNKNKNKESNDSRQLLGCIWDSRILCPDMYGHLWIGRPGEGIQIYEGSHEDSEGSVFVTQKSERGKEIAVITIEIPVKPWLTSSKSL